jgi:CHAT domain-containing protein
MVGFRTLFAAILWQANPAGAACVAIGVGVSAVAAEDGGGAPACFLANPGRGSTWRVQVAQPRDLVVSVRGRGQGAAVEVDSFEFGDETIILEGGESYTLEVREFQPEGRLITAQVTALMQNHGADAWRAAVNLTTSAKRSRNLADATQALEQWRITGDAAAISRAHLLIGDLELRAGNAAAARSAYESARSVCLPFHDARCIIEASNNSGLTALRLGDVEAALTSLTEASEYCRKLNEPVYTGQILSNLGLLAWRTGEYQRALGYYFDGRKLLRNEPAALARLLNNLGLTYLSLNEITRARAIFDAAAAERRRLPTSGPSAFLLSNLGWAHLLEKRYDRARPVLERALDQAEREKDRFARAAILVNLGHALRGLSQNPESQRRLREGLEAARAIQDRQVEGSALHQLGLLAASQNIPSEARRHFQHSIDAYQSCGQRDLEFDVTVSLAELEHQTGDTATARQLANSALPLVESLRAASGTPALRASYFSRKRSVFDLLLAIAAAEGRIEEGFLLAERARARALLDLLAAGSLELAPKPLAEERAAILRRLNFLSSRLRQPGATTPAVRQQYQLALAEHDSVEARIRDAVAPERLGDPLTSLSQVKVPAGSALLAFHLSATRGYLWLLESGKPPRLFPLPARAVVEAQAVRAASLFDSILERRRSPAAQRRFETAWSQLSATLLSPLRGERLPPRLIFVLDGALHRLPLAALKRPGHSQPLGLTHQLLRVPSAAFLTRGVFTPGRQRPVLAVADPVFSSRDSRVKAPPALPESGLNLARLPFTAEIDVLAGLLPPSRLEVLRGFAANAANLDRRRLAEYGTLHLSTHTLIEDDEPQASHIALSMVDEKGGSLGGLLYPQRLARWRLRNALVVLSACDTALGRLVPGEGLAGFTNVLLLAGAAQLVLTTSKVDAEASAEFFGHFYRNYFGAAAGNPEKSLAAAMRVMAASRRWADAYYWAPFATVGLPSPPA